MSAHDSVSEDIVMSDCLDADIEPDYDILMLVEVTNRKLTRFHESNKSQSLRRELLMNNFLTVLTEQREQLSPPSLVGDDEDEEEDEELDTLEVTAALIDDCSMVPQPDDEDDYTLCEFLEGSMACTPYEEFVSNPRSLFPQDDVAHACTDENVSLKAKRKLDSDCSDALPPKKQKEVVASVPDIDLQSGCKNQDSQRDSSLLVR